MPKVYTRADKLRTISVIIPTLNEQVNIKPLTRRLSQTFKSKRVKYEIVFVDGNSQDQTQSAIKSLKKSFPISLYTINKGGKSQALIKGFSEAKYQTLAMIDADLQYAPEDIPVMLKKLDQGADIVVANRKERSVSIIRQLLSRSFLFIFGKFLHKLDCDVQSGLKVFRKEVLNSVTLSPSNWTFDLEFLVKAKKLGYKIASVDIEFLERAHGQSKVNILITSLEIGWHALKLKFDHPRTKRLSFEFT